jgi:membrane protein DedA with SNARE-associated domain
VSASIWNGILLFAGLLVGKNWEIITTIISQYNNVLIAVTLFVIGYIIYRRYWKKKPKNPDGELNR